MEEYIGVIKLFAGNFAPQNWLMCQGQTMSIAQNTALFSILGTTYGGDGMQTFKLPNLNGTVAVGFGQSQSGSYYQLGQVGGVENVTLQQGQIPMHTHGLLVDSANASVSTPVVNNSIATPGTLNSRTFTGTLGFSTNTPSVPLNPASVGLAGSGQPHTNMQPFLGLTYIICVAGLYPPRS